MAMNIITIIKMNNSYMIIIPAANWQPFSLSVMMQAICGLNSF